MNAMFLTSCGLNITEQIRVFGIVHWKIRGVGIPRVHFQHFEGGGDEY